MLKTKVAQQLWFISQILVEFLCWGLLLGRTPLCCWGGCLGCRQRCRRPPCTTCWLGPCGGTPPTSWRSPPCLCGRDCCASPWRLSASWLSYQPLEGQKLVSPTNNICYLYLLHLNITPEKARKCANAQMQFRDKTAYVWGLRYGWDPSLSMSPARRLAHFIPPCLLLRSCSLVRHLQILAPLSFRKCDQMLTIVRPKIGSSMGKAMDMAVR